MSPKSLATVIAASVVAIAAAPAFAGDQVQFSYKNYELDTAGGANALYERLSRQARKHCTAIGVRPLYIRKVEGQCTADLTDEFVENIDHPRLYALHEAATGALRLAKRR